MNYILQLILECVSQFLTDGLARCGILSQELFFLQIFKDIPPFFTVVDLSESIVILDPLACDYLHHCLPPAPKLVGSSLSVLEFTSACRFC